MNCLRTITKLNVRKDVVTVLLTKLVITRLMDPRSLLIRFGSITGLRLALQDFRFSPTPYSYLTLEKAELREARSADPLSEKG